jgi:predicted murein hydrolase (TIGR00659 family)
MDKNAVTALSIAMTLAAYALVRALYLRYKHPLLNVVALAAALIIAALLALGLTFKDYTPAKDIMTHLLGPATVGLAVPLYRYRALLAKNASAILGSVALGSFLAMLLAACIAKLGGLPAQVIMSILPKSVSIPFAVEIAKIYNGVPSLAAAFVVATGTSGSLLGGWLLNLFRVGDPVARGLAYGTVSHGQGTATALMEGERQGAMAGLAMILSGILTAVFAPIVVWILEFLPAV